MTVEIINHLTIYKATSSHGIRSKQKNTNYLGFPHIAARPQINLFAKEKRIFIRILSKGEDLFFFSKNLL